MLKMRDKIPGLFPVDMRQFHVTNHIHTEVNETLKDTRNNKNLHPQNMHIFQT